MCCKPRGPKLPLVNFQEPVTPLHCQWLSVIQNESFSWAFDFHGVVRMHSTTMGIIIAAHSSKSVCSLGMTKALLAAILVLFQGTLLFSLSAYCDAYVLTKSYLCLLFLTPSYQAIRAFNLYFGLRDLRIREQTCWVSSYRGSTVFKNILFSWHCLPSPFQLRVKSSIEETECS